MTEAIKFPGTEMEVIEKYPFSRRLDHPTFGDVNKTTFAKGVLTEFKEVPESERELLQWVDYTPSSGYGGPYVPEKWEDGENRDIAVESMVKVDIEEVGESEFIPLFYHAKVNFWDDEDPRLSEPILATDFDEEQGCHKLAWQSFRVDDEVAVMLKEGKPVAVIGFTDGVPRVGEGIFQMEYDTIDGAPKIYQWQPGLRGIPDTEGKGQPYETFNVENKGPDVETPLALGLKNEALIICDTGEKYHEHIGPITSVWYLYWPPPTDRGYVIEDWVEVTYQQNFYNYIQQREYFFTIGPIAYVLQVLSQRLHNINICSGEGIDVYDAYYPPYHFIIKYNSDVWAYRTRFSLWSKLYDKKTKEDVIALGKIHEGIDMFPDDDLNALWVQRYFCKSVAAGDEHSMDYYDGPGINPPNPDFLLPEWGYPWPDDHRGPPWEGWVFQPDWSVRMGISYLINADWNSEDQLDGSTLKIFTRPHTKAELQAAGMWPTGAS